MAQISYVLISRYKEEMNYEQSVTFFALNNYLRKPEFT